MVEDLPIQTKRGIPSFYCTQVHAFLSQTSCFRYVFCHYSRVKRRRGVQARKGCVFLTLRKACTYKYFCYIRTYHTILYHTILCYIIVSTDIYGKASSPRGLGISNLFSGSRMARADAYRLSCHLGFGVLVFFRVRPSELNFLLQLACTAKLPPTDPKHGGDAKRKRWSWWSLSVTDR